MKKALLLVVGFLLSFIFLEAQPSYTIETVPNTRLDADTIHVSDPDDLVSPEIEQAINRVLCTVRPQADVFVVALTSIGDANVEGFANELFNKWGIGEAAKDNGVLILFLKGNRKIRFEVGYGVEPTLTDATCRDIVENTIIPYLKKEQYGEGLYKGVCHVAEVFDVEIPEDPNLSIEPLAAMDSDEEDGGPVWKTPIAIIWMSLSVILFFAFVFLLVKKVRLKPEKPKEEAKIVSNIKDLRVVVGTLGCIFPIIWLLLPFYLIAPRRRRHKARNCSCGHALRLLSEKEEDRFLNANAQFEEKINVKQYDVWYCDACGNYDIYDFLQRKASSYYTCPSCACLAGKRYKSETISSPTYSSEGVGVNYCKCQKCGAQFSNRYAIPKLVESSSSSSSDGGGGSFGGGSSGGGGYTGSW